MTLHMVELGVSNLAPSVRWYQYALGLALEQYDEPNGFALLVAVGGRIALKQQTPPVAGGVRLHFQVDDLDAELARFTTISIPITSPPKTSPEGYRRLVVTDPDGYAVTLFEWVRPPVSG